MRKRTAGVGEAQLACRAGSMTSSDAILDHEANAAVMSACNTDQDRVQVAPTATAPDSQHQGIEAWCSKIPAS